MTIRRNILEVANYLPLQILGREYYKTSFGHRYLVVVPILTHGLSAVVKRVLGERTSRPLRSLFSIAGYASLLFLLPTHYLLHRVYPSDPSPPILSLSPAELDYEYVKFGLQQWPLTNWVLYTGLTACVAWHATEGLQIIWNTWLAGNARIWKNSAKRRLITVAASVLPVFTGILVMSREPLMVFSGTADRYETAFRRLVMFR